jgi:hypothetical protein
LKVYIHNIEFRGEKRKMENINGNLQSECKILNQDFLKEIKYEISSQVDKCDALRSISDIFCKEKELVNAVETYLKLECYESYKNNNLEEVFKKAIYDEEIKSKVLYSISRFILN